MSPKQIVAKLAASAFLDEIHHLLWIEPRMNHGNWDEGWCCRDHAWLTGVVCQLLNLPALVVYGEAYFVQGPRRKAPPIGLAQTTHSWVAIEGVGVMDLSPNLLKCREPRWPSWPLQCIAMNQCIPDGIFNFAKSYEEYDRKVARATHAPSRQAIYWEKGNYTIDLEFVENAFDTINSPLSVKLFERFDSTVYSRAAIHLFKYLNGEGSSLRHLSQEDAWLAISKGPDDPIGWLKTNGGIR